MLGVGNVDGKDTLVEMNFNILPRRLISHKYQVGRLWKQAWHFKLMLLIK